MLECRDLNKVVISVLFWFGLVFYKWQLLCSQDTTFTSQETNPDGKHGTIFRAISL